MKVLRIAGLILAVLLLIVVAAAFGASAMADRAMAQRHPIPAITPIAIPSDSTAIARGSHLANAVANCVECHGADLGGLVFMDAGPVGVASAPNLTRGAGGVGATFTDSDWIRAIKYGIRADSTSLVIMPSETFAHLSDSDLGALIAYLKQLPAIDREVPKTRFGVLGKVMLATGALPILVADKTPRVQTVEVTPGVTVEYGKYLADISGCRGCHGLNLSGGAVAGPPGIPPASNLTPLGPIANWSEEIFSASFVMGSGRTARR
jgi:cytochrome c553